MKKGARIAAGALVRSEYKRPKLGFRDKFIRTRDQPSGLELVCGELLISVENQ